MKVLPISENKKFKYSIYFQSFDEESLEMGSSVDSGYEKIESVDTIGDILRLANSTYGIYYPVSFGVWESTEPLQNTEYFEKGIRKYFSLHIHNEDGTDIPSDENDFITFLLSDGQYNSEVFEEYAIGGVVLGALLGVGALITYFYFKNKKVSDSYTSTNPRAKSVVRNINGKDRKFPIKDAWRNEHNIENKRENYEVPQGQRLNKFELGGDVSEYYHEIEYGQGGVAKAKDIIINKIGWNENIADYLVSKSEKFAIWLADSILKKETELRQEPKGNVLYALNERAISINTNFLNNYYSTEIREILDWLQHPLTPKQELKQLSFDQALEKAREWHEELEVLGGDVDFIEPDTNIILKTYPKNKEGIEYYWSLIPSNFCDLESSRMGHCGRTGYNNQLISLRSIRPYGKGHTINDSHVTIAYGVADGLFKQIKGKKNNKPAEKYFPYIFDLIKSILDGQINKKLEEVRSKKENEVKDAIEKIDALSNELSQEVLFSIYSPSSTQLAFLKGERENFLESKSLSMNPLSYVNNDGFIADNVRLLVRLKDKQLEVRNNRDWDAIESEMDRLLKENLDYYRKNIVEKYKEYDKLNKLVNAQRQTTPTLMFNGFGSEYASENDYSFEDMTDEELRELFKINRSVFQDAKTILSLYDKNIISKNELQDKIIMYGLDNYVMQLELFNRGIVSEKPNTKFTLNYSCGEVDRLLNSSGNTSLVEGLLCGDFDDEYYDNFSYYFDNPSDLVDNLDKENSKRIIDEIVRITNYDESEVIENGINYYLNGEDENFTKDDFDGICRSLANAQNYADRDDYYVYAQKELRSAIEELGKVEYLDDRGLSIEIDLLNIKTEKEIAEEMDYYGIESVSDLFEELLSAGNLNYDLPKFEIDDRYSPYGDTKVFNDYLSDSDLETYNKGGKLKTKNTIKNNKIKTMNSLDSEFKGGGNVGAISKTKIVITENKEENKIQATRTLVKENSEGEKITYELLVGKHTDKESKPNRYADGWFEIYATDEDDNEYFYAEGGLWLQGNKVVDYDGVYELSEKLRPLMSALNMNTSDIFSEGGAVKSKRRKKRQPKVTRIQFEEGNYEYAGGGNVDERLKDWYIKNYPTDDLGAEMYDDASFEDLWKGILEGEDVYEIMGVGDSIVRERLFEHLAKLQGVEYGHIYDIWLESEEYAGGGRVKSKRKKKRQPKVTRIQFEEGNYEYAGGGGVDDYIEEQVKQFNNDEYAMEKQYGKENIKGIEYQGFLAIDENNENYERLSDYEFEGEEFDIYNLLEVAKKYPQADYITFHARLMGESDFGIEDELSPIDDLAMEFDMNKLNQFANGGEADDDDNDDDNDENDYAGGGEVLDWMEEALISLMEETGSNDIEISYVSNDGTEFYATDNDVEYRVFKTEDDAERVAVEQVREDMEETPENFNQDFIAGYVDGRDFFTEALNEMNYSYANDIQTESDDRYENRLIAEMVENGLMDEEDAESGNADELADYYKDDYVSLLTEGQLNEGANGLQHFIDNFGEEEAMRIVIENNLIDIERASTDAVRVDGIAHFLSSYDGETLYLSNNYVAYRIN